MPDFLHSAVLIVVAVIALKLIDLATTFFFKKLTKDDYITKAECVKLRESCPSSKTTNDLNEFKKEIRTSLGVIKGLLLGMAVKAGIPVEEYKDLVD